jgi:hypothetical protein
VVAAEPFDVGPAAGPPDSCGCTTAVSISTTRLSSVVTPAAGDLAPPPESASRADEDAAYDAALAEKAAADAVAEVRDVTELTTPGEGNGQSAEPKSPL